MDKSLFLSIICNRDVECLSCIGIQGMRRRSIRLGRGLSKWLRRRSMNEGD
jgi:hypothetical protein